MLDVEHSYVDRTCDRWREGGRIQIEIEDGEHPSVGRTKRVIVVGIFSYIIVINIIINMCSWPLPKRVS